MTIPRTARVLKALVRPEILVRAFLKHAPVGSLEFRLAFDAFERPSYAHGIYHAARLGRLLGHRAISVIEFGVAGGGGLVAMEDLAAAVGSRLDVRVDVYGFDTGQGLPEHSDYRDLPYIWRKGGYKMDVEAVRGRLRKAELILGDVRETVARFLDRPKVAPIGFISFDLDYYSSTVGALKIFDGPDAGYLPRILCHFDDIMSGDQQYLCEDVGELLAIREFNDAAARHHRIRPIYGWQNSLLLEPGWAKSMWAYHRFDHDRYDTFIGRGHDAVEHGS